MPHGKTALTLMMALAMPGAVQALGLGEIHLDSALDEPLAADIDLVGATEEDLAGITASIADRQTFEHYGVDRSPFLSGVAFKISRDGGGRAVLTIRSKDACTEPLLNVLVDVRWGGGELIRQYTLLLDPPGFPSAASLRHAVPVSVQREAPQALIERSKPAGEAFPTPERASMTTGEAAPRKTIKVGAKATLRGVAWRVGARSDADLNRMMIAIFRANPNAFEGNINRLLRGAVLTIPSATEVSAISVANANREVHAQMRAWHASTPGAAPTKSVAPAVAATVTAAHESPVPGPAAAGSADSTATEPSVAAGDRRAAAAPAAPAEAALDRRIEQLEKGLGELRDQLDIEQDALVRAQARLTRAENAPAELAPPQAPGGRGLRASIAAILALGGAAFGVYAWRRRRAPKSQPAPVDPNLSNLAPVAEASPGAVFEAAAPNTPVLVVPRAVQVEPHHVPHEPHDHAKPDEAPDPQDAIDAEALEVSYLLQGSGGGFDEIVKVGDTDETASLPLTVKLCVDDPDAVTMPVKTARIAGSAEATARGPGVPQDARTGNQPVIDATKLDYNLLDLDATVQHVQMPSALHENVGFKERRTSLVDVLKRAVEREPNRGDLRMKLLETYFAAAATNRQAFLETFQKIERASLDEGEWDKIAWMGRQIASDVELFAPPVVKQPDEDDLVNCA